MTVLDPESSVVPDETEAADILVSVDHDPTRDTLVEWLAPRHGVETVDAAAIDTDGMDPDILIVDQQALDLARVAIEAIRAAAMPAYVPTLLVVTPGETAAPSAADAFADPFVDEVARTPLANHEVADHLRSLLRVRAFSRRIADDLDRYLAAMDAVGEGITIADVTRPDDPLIYANEAFAEITGYDPAEIAGRNCRFLQGPDTDPDAVARMRTAIEARDPVSVRLRNYRKDGTPFWNRVRLLPIAEGGEVTHYVGIQRDVTDRVRYEERLEWYRAVVQAAGDPIYTLDVDGRFTDVNDSFIEFTGYDEDDLLGARASLVIDQQDVTACETVITDLLRGGDDIDGTAEIIVETTDGDRRLCEVSIGLLPGESFRGTVGVVRDITEPKGREQRLAVLERVLRHDLKNKLNVVLGRMEALADRNDLDAQAREHVAVVTGVAEDLVGISDAAREFRDVLALQANEPGTGDAAEIVRDVVEDKRRAFEHARLSVDAPDTAPVRTRGRIPIAIDELVENAIEHTDLDEPTVEITADVADDVVRIQVADDGPGVPKMEQATLANSTEQQLEHGSGLGLWLVAWTVEQSGGSLDIADNEPRGTVVTLTLPRAE